MKQFGELVQTADWKTEKHVPVIDCLEQAFSSPETGYRQHITVAQLRMYVSQLIEAFETGDKKLLDGYHKASEQMRELFHAWFTPTTKQARGRA